MRLLGRLPAMRVGVLGFAIMAAPLWLLVATMPFGLMVAVMFLFGVGGPLGVAPIGGVLTTRSPADIRPKVVAAFLALTAVGSPVGALWAGFGVERIGFSATYAAVAASLTAATIVLALATRQLGMLASSAPSPTPS
jgi:predicted MFS family arabinose efflux permease